MNRMLKDKSRAEGKNVGTFGALESIETEAQAIEYSNSIRSVFAVVTNLSTKNAVTNDGCLPSTSMEF